MKHHFSCRLDEGEFVMAPSWTDTAIVLVLGVGMSHSYLLELIVRR